MRNFIYALFMACAGLSTQAREVVLIDEPFKVDWSDSHYVDAMQLVGAEPGEVIHVYTGDFKDYAQVTVGIGWNAIDGFQGKRIYEDFEIVLDNKLLEDLENSKLVFRGDGFTIRKVTLFTEREEDTREGYDELSDASANRSTQRIYDLLRDCYGKKSITCSMAEVDWNYKEAGNVKTWTGSYPAMNGFDYIHLSYDWEYYNDIEPVKEWWDMGGLVTICWHWRAPSTQAIWEAYKKDNNENTVYEGFYTPGEGNPTTSISAANAVKEGTWENEFVRHDLEKVAIRLKKLQDAGIVVIWRPFHEASGNIEQFNNGKAWFWWGADGAEPCVALWHMMYDYFREQGLHNLIWVWTSQTKDRKWYPGDNYVDMIGRDLYNYSLEDAAYNFKYLQTYYPHKMLALSECGYSGGTSPYVGDQWEEGAKWSYAMPWYDYDYKIGQKHQYANDDWWQDWFGRDNVITMNEMKELKEQYLSTPPSSVSDLTNDDEDASQTWYTIQGMPVNEPTAPGIYIKNGKKVIIK